MRSRNHRPLARRQILAAAGVALLATLVPGAVPAQDAPPVVIASAEDVTSLDPHLINANHPIGSLIWSMFDSLVRRDRDGAHVPRLATSWEQVNPTTWRFKLREGVKFHNGEDFNAQAVAYNFERSNTPPYATESQLHDQTGLKEVKVVDDYTIDLITEEPTVNMLYWLEEAFIGAPKYMQDTPPDVVATNPVGSGPYKFVEWRKGDRVVITANEEYWGGAPAIKDVVFRVVPEISSRVNELKAGSVDLVVGLTPDSAELADSPTSQAVAVEGLRKMHMGIGLKGEPALKDARVRQALNHAVDVQTMIETLQRGTTSPLKSIVNPPNNNPALEPFTYDPEQAKKLLGEAGYADGFPLPIHYSTRYPGGKEASEATAAYLEQVGIKPKIEFIELGQFREMLRDASFPGIYFYGWAALINPSVELVILTCGHIDNSSGYCNPEYDELVKKASVTLDDAERQKLEFAAQEIIWKDAPWLYLWRLPVIYGVSNRLDFEPRLDNYVEIYRAKLKS
jgi:peptide/nickel transport system substrate-binding protein